LRKFVPMARYLLGGTLFVLVLITQALSLQRCATPTAPSGGARDTIGPQLVEEETTPNFQTNFFPEVIELTFDEWVELDQKQQILISPPLELGPDNRPVLRKRTLVIPFDGLTLRDSVTYVVNIGSAIKDLNEGNPTENLRFVFATGPVLDSAKVSGVLVDDYSGEPLENATFTLYDNLADTAVYSTNPTYFAQTDKEGNFTVFNVRPGRYRAVALVRSPSATNYFLDFEGFSKPLAVGTLDTFLLVQDGDNAVGNLRVSPVPKPIRINEVDSSYVGSTKLVFNQEAEKLDIRTQNSYFRSFNRDSLSLFYRPEREGTDSLIVFRGEESGDTAVFNLSGNTRTLPALMVQKSPPGRINPVDGVIYLFNRPIDRIDSTAVALLRDTLVDPLPISFELDTLNPLRLRFRSNWEPNVDYRLSILPGGITDWYGQANTDTLVAKFRVEQLEKFGDLTLRVSGLDTNAVYLLRLVEKDKPLAETQRVLRETESTVISYTTLKPATYVVEIIEDANDNGRYDGGDYRYGRQPEVIRRFDIEALRANWEVDERIELKN
jgi:hypothetical protein